MSTMFYLDIAALFKGDHVAAVAHDDLSSIKALQDTLEQIVESISSVLRTVPKASFSTLDMKQSNAG